VLNGGVAEWLGTGLQNPVRRFESALTPLLTNKHHQTKIVYEL
jgi:hypothetical protein